jgi:hypothetical protein
MRLYLKRIYYGFGSLKKLLNLDASRLKVLRGELIQKKFDGRNHESEIDYERLSQYLAR